MKDLLRFLEATSGVTPARRQEGRCQRRDVRYQRLTSRNEVMRAVRDWWEAWFSGNLERLAALTCERYIEFAADGEVILAGKKALVEQARNSSGLVKISEWAIIKSKVGRLEDAAVCNYDFRLTGTFGHASFNMEGPVTDVLVRFGGMWKLVAHHGNFPTALYPVRPTVIIPVLESRPLNHPSPTSR